MQSGTNQVEAYKAAKGGDGLRIREDLPRILEQGWESLTPADKELLKWVGVFFRRPTPGRFMMRIRMPNGFATSRQLRAIAELSRRLGNSVLDITTRQQIELRGFALESVPEIWEKLRGVDLHSLQTGMDNVRNLNGCPLAGLTPNELLDASPIVFELDRLIVGADGNPEFTDLPRKFNLTVTGCLVNCTPCESQDIALAPAMAGERIGFNLLVGGKMGSGGFVVASPLDVFVEPHEAAAVTLELIRIFRDHGPREARSKCRFAFLIESWGLGRLRDELAARLQRDLKPAGVDMRRPHRSDHLGTVPQKQPGLIAVGLCVPTGRVNPDQLSELARLADVYGDGQVRFTTAQNAIIPNVAAEREPALHGEPLLKDLVPRPSPFLRGLVACVGTDFCNLALIETKRRALELSAALEQRLGPDHGPLTIHWSGCPAGCGNHQAADIGLRGLRANIGGRLVDAVAIYVGGQTGPEAVPGEQIMDTVPCDESLPDVVAAVIQNLPRFKKRKTDVATEEPLPAPQAAASDALYPVEALAGRAAPRGGNGNGHGAAAAGVAVVAGRRARACTLEELSRDKTRMVTVEGRPLALFAVEGSILAIEAQCPHQGGPLHEGTIEDGRIFCPWHRYGFDLTSGRCDADPSLSLKTYPTFVEEGSIFVQLE